MVCCIAAAFVFGLFARFFRKIFRRPDLAPQATPPPTPRIELSRREPSPTRTDRSVAPQRRDALVETVA